VIPYPIAPLTGLSILVTRPAAQSISLCARINALGGVAIAFPTIDIESLNAQAPTQSFDCVIFVSANAVEHGLQYVANTAAIAAIGPATAKALVDAKRSVDYLAPSPYNSEALLGLPEFNDVAGKRILIVRGEGGRETLHDTLVERGAEVQYINVYRRVRAQPTSQATSQALAQIDELGREGQVQLVTLTSVDVLDHWIALLGPRATHFMHAAFIAPSARIEVAARAYGLQGEYIPASSANDDALIGAMANWHARSRA
jgi:uroporphyrinogen-III synthase